MATMASRPQASSNRSDNGERSVFRRLYQTDTVAFSYKHKKDPELSTRPQSHNTKISRKKIKDNDTIPPVFERLARAETQAFAPKRRPPVEHISSHRDSIRKTPKKPVAFPNYKFGCTSAPGIIALETHRTQNNGPSVFERLAQTQTLSSNPKLRRTNCLSPSTQRTYAPAKTKPCDLVTSEITCGRVHSRGHRMNPYPPQTQRLYTKSPLANNRLVVTAGDPVKTQFPTQSIFDRLSAAETFSSKQKKQDVIRHSSRPLVSQHAANAWRKKKGSHGRKSMQTNGFVGNKGVAVSGSNAKNTYGMSRTPRKLDRNEGLPTEISFHTPSQPLPDEKSNLNCNFHLATPQDCPSKDFPSSGCKIEISSRVHETEEIKEEGNENMTDEGRGGKSHGVAGLIDQLTEMET